MIEQKFHQQDAVIQQMQSDNTQLSLGLQKKDEENRQLAELVKDVEKRMKKAIAASKTNLKYKKEAKEKDRDLHKVRKDAINLKHQNQNLGQQLKDAKHNQVTVAARPVPARLYSANP